MVYKVNIYNYTNKIRFLINKSIDVSDKYYNVKRLIDNYKIKHNIILNVINKQELYWIEKKEL